MLQSQVLVPGFIVGEADLEHGRAGRSDHGQDKRRVAVQRRPVGGQLPFPGEIAYEPRETVDEVRPVGPTIGEGKDLGRKHASFCQPRLRFWAAERTHMLT